MDHNLPSDQLVLVAVDRVVDHILSRCLHVAFPDVYHVHDLLDIHRPQVHPIPKHSHLFHSLLDNDTLPHMRKIWFPVIEIML